MAASCVAVSAKVRTSRKVRARGWEPRRRNIEAKAWAASQPADRKRPDLDALMADLDAPERKALQALENAKGFLAERQGKS
jgi:hypothetical protein